MKNLRKTLYFVLIVVEILFFIGCSSVPDAFLTERKLWSKPEIGSVSTSFIGDTVVQEGIEDATDAITLKEDHGSFGWTAYHPAGNYKYCGKGKIRASTGRRDVSGNVIYEEVEVKKFRFFNKYPNGWGYSYPLIYKYPNDDVYLKVNSGVEKIGKNEYKEGKVYEDSGYYFDQQLIYTGAEGNILKFSYREFQNDIARAAFTVDATYDVSKDKILRFKNCTLEVISFDNQSITYKLLSGFKTE